VRIVLRPLLPIALVAPELGILANALKGQVERRLSKLLHELARVRFVSGARQLVVNRQSHVVSLPFILQRPGQSVTHEMALAARTLPTRPARRRRARMKKDRYFARNDRIRSWPDL